ncbi:MAG: helix-turn-helix transcriptional regulator [Thiobacillus sp.]|nr:helix-turn-helix transcriptional regulator [Thiobacillus sp.]
MSTSRALTNVNNSQEDGLEEMFASLPPLDPFDIKKDEVSALLAALMAFSDVKRTELADKLTWKKSRVTSVLSGRANPTLKTIWEFSSILGYDFDIVFRAFDEQRAKQPWQRLANLVTPSHSEVKRQKSFVQPIYEAQTPQEVVRDIVTGHAKPLYVSVYMPSESGLKSSTMIEVTPQRALPQPSVTLTIPQEDHSYAHQDH